ncbi:uncharacterized protein LOC120520061 [Polypterus senegalus]
MSRPCLQRVLISKVRGVLKMSKITALKLTTDGKFRRFLREQRLRPFCDFIFESDFLEITETGQLSSILGGLQVVTVGIASSEPAFPLLNAMLIARAAVEKDEDDDDEEEEEEEEEDEWRRKKSYRRAARMELRRLIPLEAVSLSVLKEEQQQLRVELVTGRVYYLQLLAPTGLEKLVFDLWISFIKKLEVPKVADETLGEIGRLAVRCSEDDQKTLHAFCGNVILENNFVEVTRSGHFHSQAGLSVVTLLVASTNPFLRKPEKLLVGRPVPRVLGAKDDGHLHRGLRHLQSKCSTAKGGWHHFTEITRCLPLSDVKLTVHSEALRLLRLELRTGPVYYLRLLVAPGAAKDAFDLWVKLAIKLREMSPEEEKVRPCGQSLAERLLSLDLEDPLHSLCDNALLESDFAEVREDGNALTTRAGVPQLTVLVTSSNPFVQVPDLILVGIPYDRHLATPTKKKKKISHAACPGRKRCKHWNMELTRRLPLSEVRLAVHSEERQQLKVELRTGHTHHLRLLAAAGNEKAVFEQWVRLVSLLGEGATAQDPKDDELLSTEEPEDEPVSEVGPEVQDVVEVEVEVEVEPEVQDEWAEGQEEPPPRGPRVVRAHEDVDRHLDKKKGLHIKLDGLLERVDLACDLALNALG